MTECPSDRGALDYGARRALRPEARGKQSCALEEHLEGGKERPEACKQQEGSLVRGAPWSKRSTAPRRSAWEEDRREEHKLCLGGEENLASSREEERQAAPRR